MSIELENKWAMAVKENADLRQQLAEARAEAADWKMLYESHKEEVISSRITLAGAELDRDRANEQLAAQAAELATLRERLAAAEKRMQEMAGGIG